MAEKLDGKNKSCIGTGSFLSTGVVSSQKVPTVWIVGVQLALDCFF